MHYLFALTLTRYVNRKLKLSIESWIGAHFFPCFDSLANYVPIIYAAPCVMFLMRADPLRGQVGGGWAMEIESFLGPVKWHRADRRLPFHRAQKLETVHIQSK
jgi:hypothetical protein